MSMLGKFKPARQKLTLPFWVIFYLSLLAFACCLGLIAVAQPILWLTGNISALNGAIAAIIAAGLAALVFGIAKLVGKVVP